jgi:hypothetical protein
MEAGLSNYIRYYYKHSFDGLGITSGEIGDFLAQITMYHSYTNY